MGLLSETSECVLWTSVGSVRIATLWGELSRLLPGLVVHRHDRGAGIWHVVDQACNGMGRAICDCGN